MGPPLPRNTGNSAVFGRHRSNHRNPCKLPTLMATCNRCCKSANTEKRWLGGLVSGRGRDERRDVLRLLPHEELGRHLALAPRAAVLDRVFDELLRRPQLIEVRPDAPGGL